MQACRDMWVFECGDMWVCGYGDTYIYIYRHIAMLIYKQVVDNGMWENGYVDIQIYESTDVWIYGRYIHIYAVMDIWIQRYVAT